MEFKKSLIVSILKKRMVPMLYFARLAGAELILDGGHRTRAICEFMDNKFSVSVTDPNGVNTECFYSKSGENTLGDRVKSYFDSYPLPVYRYTDIDEDEAREIFNELQHFRSMTVSECCNAHSSHLIDYMRKLKDVSLVMGHHTKTVYETLESGSNAFHHPKCHEYILTLLQLFSFFDGQSCESALGDCKGGKDTICYLKDFKQDELADEYTAEFVSTLQKFFYFVERVGKIKVTSMYSVYHYMVWHDISDYDQYFSTMTDFLSRVSEYETNVKIRKTLTNQKKHEEAAAIQEILDNYNDTISKWYETTVMRGKSYNSGRKLRLDMMKDMLPYAEIQKADEGEFVDMIDPMLPMD